MRSWTSTAVEIRKVMKSLFLINIQIKWSRKLHSVEIADQNLVEVKRNRQLKWMNGCNTWMKRETDWRITIPLVMASTFEFESATPLILWEWKHKFYEEQWRQLWTLVHYLTAYLALFFVVLQSNEAKRKRKKRERQN